MDDPGEVQRRRRRARRRDNDGTREPGRRESARSETPVPGPPAAAKPRPPRRRPDAAERGLRGLVGAGPSHLGVSGALRGRDVNRPTAADLAEAERDVVIVHRHWRPPT